MGDELSLLENINKKINNVPFRLQDYFSDVCGEFTIFFAYHLCRKKRLDEIMKYFTRSHTDNDAKVRHFVRKNFQDDSIVIS